MPPSKTDTPLWSALSAPQQRFVRSVLFEILYGGAKGGAKTESLIVAALQQIHSPNYRGLLLRTEWDELKEIMSRCRKYYAPLGAVFKATTREHGDQWVFPSGAIIEVGYYKNKEDIDRYQGREWTYIGFDEIGNLAEEEAWSLLLAEIRSPDKSLKRLARCTANPGGKGHGWIKRRFVVPSNYGKDVYRDPDTGLARAFIASKVSDNPIYRHDPQYMAQLQGLPEMRRRQLLDGDWDAGEGMAFDMLSWPVHRSEPFPIPDWWYRWGALDIGYQHCWCFTHAAMSPEGVAYLVDSVHGHKDLYDTVAQRLKESVPGVGGMQIATDNYALTKGSRGYKDRTPSPAEILYDYGIVNVGRGNLARVPGLNNLRLWLSWSSTSEAKKLPKLRFFDTPGNRKTFECLEAMVMDEKNAEDVLKVDADQFGRGGDDPYDCLRYLMADHPYTASPPTPQRAVPQFGQDPYSPDDLIGGEDNDDTIGGLPAGF